MAPSERNPPGHRASGVIGSVFVACDRPASFRQRCSRASRQQSPRSRSAAQRAGPLGTHVKLEPEHSLLTQHAGVIEGRNALDEHGERGTGDGAGDLPQREPEKVVFAAMTPEIQASGVREIVSFDRAIDRIDSVIARVASASCAGACGRHDVAYHRG